MNQSVVAVDIEEAKHEGIPLIEKVVSKYFECIF
jgi:hypothetical protein